MHGGVLIRTARKRAGISQAALADRLHTKQSVVARWESLTTSPSVETVSSAVGACGFDIDWRVIPVDPDLERVLRDQLRRTPAQRVAAVVELARLRGRA